MIQLSFVVGKEIRKVYIRGRIISLISAETNFVPLRIELDRLEDQKYNSKIKKKLGKDAIKTLEEIKKLKTEKEMAEDVKKDFQETGWRLIRKS